MPTLKEFADELNIRTGSTGIVEDSDLIEEFISSWNEKYQLVMRRDDETFSQIDFYDAIEDDYAELTMYGEDSQELYSEVIYFTNDSYAKVALIAAFWAEVANTLDKNAQALKSKIQNKLALDEAQKTGKTSLEPDETRRLAETLFHLGYKIVKD